MRAHAAGDPDRVSQTHAAPDPWHLSGCCVKTTNLGDRAKGHNDGYINP